ncbi:MAG: adenine phosphoribosyltransferase [Bacteroidales bacterium]|nr:adenine phosphoribosyltransferase [Bacteroidales bacterium]
MQFEKTKIRTIDDFPTPGIKFYDITTLLNDREAYHAVMDEMLKIAREVKPEVIVALESRGFFFGPVLAYELGVPFVPVRKKGKLPAETFQETYNLEYGTATVEIHRDAMPKGKRLLLVDDVLATGGSMNAAIKLVEHFQPTEVNLLFLMELAALKGRDKLKKFNTYSLLQL